MLSGRVILGKLFGDAVDITAYPNLTGGRAGMSAYRRIPDMVQRRVERVLMTLSGPSARVLAGSPSLTTSIRMRFATFSWVTMVRVFAWLAE